VAFWLVELGIPVFAAPPLEQTPTRNSEFELPLGWQESPPTANLSEWQPGWALCLFTGFGIDGVDVDVRGGANIELERRALDDLHVAIIGEVRTPSGGRHFYVPSAGLRSSNSRTHGVDFRGRGVDGSGGRYVYLPGTVRTRRSPGCYQWLETPNIDTVVSIELERARQWTYLESRGHRPTTTALRSR